MAVVGTAVDTTSAGVNDDNDDNDDDNDDDDDNGEEDKPANTRLEVDANTVVVSFG